MKKHRIRVKQGQVFEIVLDGGKCAYGQVLRPPIKRFFATIQPAPVAMDDVLRDEVAFVLPTHDLPVQSGQWRVIGTSDLWESDYVPARFFRQDPFSKAVFIVTEGGSEVAALPGQIAGLDRWSVWAAEHVECRLKCLNAGTECRIVVQERKLE